MSARKLFQFVCDGLQTCAITNINYKMRHHSITEPGVKEIIHTKQLAQYYKILKLSVGSANFEL